MGKIVKLAVLVGVIYFGITYGKPWVESLIDRRGGMASGGDDDAGRCLREAERATETFTEQLARLTTPIDKEQWASGLSTAEGQVSRARASCVCEETTCEKAHAALEQLARLMESTDRTIRSGEGFFNPANEVDEIQNLLNEAAGDQY